MFLGAYRLVPPFLPPSGCPAIPACAQHSRLKEGCRRCEEVARSAAAAKAVPSAAHEAEGRGAMSTPQARVFLGLPVPPVKFYTRARVRTSSALLTLLRPNYSDLKTRGPVLVRPPTNRRACKRCKRCKRRRRAEHAYAVTCVALPTKNVDSWNKSTTGSSVFFLCDNR